MSRTDFRITGQPDPQLTASVGSAGVIIAKQTGFGIYIHDILTFADTSLKENDNGGDVIVYAPEGHSPLQAAIKIGADTDVYAASGSVTVTYSYYRID